MKLLNEDLPLRGFLKCQDCGDLHTGAKCKDKLQYYYYYWCNKCQGKNYSAIKVHADIEKILKGLSLTQKHVDGMKALAEIEINATKKEHSSKLEKAKWRKRCTLWKKNI